MPFIVKQRVTIDGEMFADALVSYNRHSVNFTKTHAEAKRHPIARIHKTLSIVRAAIAAAERK